MRSGDDLGRLRAAAPVVLFLLSACMHYRARPVQLGTSAQTLLCRQLDSSAVERVIVEHEPELAAAWPPRQWTPELLALAAIALHPELDVARADWETAKAALRTASERPNPTATAGIEHKSGSGSTTPWVTTLSFDVPIETAGKRGVRIAQAKALSVATASDFDQAIWNVRTRALNAATDLAAARQLIDVRREEVRVRREIVDMLQQRLAIGEAAQPDVTRVRADERASRLLLRESEGMAALREAALAAAIGISVAALPPLDLTPLLDTPPLVAESTTRLRELALTARPDVLAALARYHAADEALRLEIRRQYPDIHIGPGIGWDQGAFKWALGATAELPIMNQHRGAIAEADARRGAVAAQLAALQAKVLGDLEGALASERSARVRLAEAEHLLAAKRSLVAAARRQFDAGELDRLALRNQEIELRLAEVDRSIALFELQRAVVAVESTVEQPQRVTGMAR